MRLPLRDKILDLYEAHKGMGMPVGAGRHIGQKQAG